MHYADLYTYLLLTRSRLKTEGRGPERFAAHSECKLHCVQGWSALSGFPAITSAASSSA